MPNQPAQLGDPNRGRKTGAWTKYGGASLGMIKERLGEEWCCQACGDDIPSELKPFLLEFHQNDFIRVCNKCISIAMRQEGSSFVRFTSLIRVVRSKRD